MEKQITLVITYHLHFVPLLEIFVRAKTSGRNRSSVCALACACVARVCARLDDNLSSWKNNQIGREIRSRAVYVVEL